MKRKQTNCMGCSNKSSKDCGKVVKRQTDSSGVVFIKVADSRCTK